MALTRPGGKNELLKKIQDYDIIHTCQKGVIYVHNYIFNLEINQDCYLVMVVDCINIVAGWRIFWTHIVIHSLTMFLDGRLPVFFILRTK